MPIALAVSHTSMHPRAHGVGPAGTTINMHGTPWHSVTPHAHTHSPTHWAAIVREYLDVAMADE